MRMIVPTALDPTRRSKEATAFEQVLRRNVVGQDQAISAVLEIYQMCLGRPERTGTSGTLIWNCEHANGGLECGMDGNTLACDLHRSLFQSEAGSKVMADRACPGEVVEYAGSKTLCFLGSVLWDLSIFLCGA